MQFHNYTLPPKISPDYKKELEDSTGGVMKLHPDTRTKTTIRRFLTIENAFNKKHNHRYDYSLSVYESYDVDMDMICETHGIFKRSAGSHLLGYGCLSCDDCHTRKSYIDNDAILYLVYLVKTGYYKFGITLYDVEKRLKYEGVEYRIVKIWNFPKLGQLAKEAEKYIRWKTEDFQIDESEKIFKKTGNTEVRNINVLSYCEEEVKKVCLENLYESEYETLFVK